MKITSKLPPNAKAHKGKTFIGLSKASVHVITTLGLVKLKYFFFGELSLTLMSIIVVLHPPSVSGIYKRQCVGFESKGIVRRCVVSRGPSSKPNRSRNYKKKWIKFPADVRAMRRADIGTDHQLVRVKIRIRLRANRNTGKKRARHNLAKIKEHEIPERYHAILDHECIKDSGINKLWNRHKETLDKALVIETAETENGYQKIQMKE
ncbi:hypothetical protein FQA39_LY02195 [Lamprigera yunnana]|nr:hypothetical protein FQA39_LY02195 [Lamprigera yunnana]